MNKGVLLILDGYGEGKPYEYNAVTNAKTPFLNSLKKGSSLLKTSGEAVGLFAGEMGGSEVGHTTIGAGRIIPSTAKKIKDDIDSGEFEKNKQIIKLLSNIKKNNSNLHLFGLMSDKNIHSDINHCMKIIDIAKDKAKNIFIHFVTDGRDCGAYDSLKYLTKLQNFIKNIKNCHILSVSGRFYAMDRENYLERTKTALNAMFLSNKGILEREIKTYIQNQHKNGTNDQYILPVHIKNKEYNGIDKNDYIYFFNFREDRLRQVVKECEAFNCNLVTMAEVANTKAEAVYKSKIVNNTLSEYLAKNGLKQIKISETTKYAHVTYFLNGGKEEPFENEERVHVPTIETNDYSLTPKMQAKEITKQTNIAITKGYDAVIVNFSNSDMIGHTGNYDASVEALQYLDKCVKKIVKQANKNGYFVLITADHGNSEHMKLDNGEPDMAHTLNDVFCAVANRQVELKSNGELKDVAPTFVELLGIEQNKHFKGESLIIK